MTVKFPLSSKDIPGSVYTYDSSNTDARIDESVITNKNILDAYNKIIASLPSDSDTIAFKVKINANKIITEILPFEAKDLPIHTHTNNSSGGVIYTQPRLFTLALLPNITEYTIIDEVYTTLYGMYINGIFINDFTKQPNNILKLGFNVDMNCQAKLLY